MAKLFIPVVLGTAREGRASEKVAQAIVKEVEKLPEVETELVDIKNHPYTITTPPWGPGGANEKETAWKRTADRADGFMLVVPEYNRGYPGELKLFLDSLHDSYDKKPALVCGVSAGIFGGRALVEHMRPVLAELKMVPVRGGVFIGNAKKLFDEQGELTDPKFTERLTGKLEELVWFAHALRNART